MSFSSLRNVSWKGKNLQGTDFKGADLTGADLSGANLRDADFSFADLSNANFTDAVIEGAKFGNTKIYNTAGLSMKLRTVVTNVENTNFRRQSLPAYVKPKREAGNDSDSDAEIILIREKRKPTTSVIKPKIEGYSTLQQYYNSWRTSR